MAIITYTQNIINFCRTIFLLLLFSTACSPDQEQEQQAKSSLIPGEEKDTYQPLVNALGDTVLTGVEIPIVGKKRSINEVMNVRVVPVGKPVITPAHPNVFEAEQLKTVLPVESVDIKTYTVGSIPDPRPLINSIGDTIPTGVPIPAIGKRVPVKWPEPIPALAPRYMDNATIDIKFLGVEQGLPTNSVHSILQDSRGHFWFGTNGGGATLYDGVTFRHFTEANGLMENSVYEVFEDSKGRIWFGTKKGFMYLDGAEFVQFTESDGYASTETMKIMEDRSGNLWFGGWSQGLCKYDGEAFTYYSEREGFQGMRISALLEGRDGSIWIGTKQRGLFKFDGSAFTQFSFTGASTEINHVIAIYEDAGGNLWVGTQAGLYVYNGRQLELYSKDSELQIIRKITKDHQGNLWFGSTQYGLVKFDGRNFTHINTEEGISDSRIYDIRIVESGKIWIATSGGVNIYDPNSFQYSKVLSNATVRSIFQDSKGNLWFGTTNNGVYKYDGQHYYQFTEDQGFINWNSGIWAIEEDNDGNIWFGADQGNGIIKYDGLNKSTTSETNRRGTFTHYSPRESSSSLLFVFVNSLIKDKHHRLWIGFDGGGLLRFDGKTFNQFTTNEGLISNKVLPKIVEDQGGHLWVFTDRGGVTKIDPGNQADKPVSLIHFSEREGFTNGIIHSILPDPLGNTWLAEKSGTVYTYHNSISSSDAKLFTRLNLDEFRDQKQIKSMIRDPKGDIWLSSQTGLDRLVLDSSGPSETAVSSTSYGIQDGLKALHFYRPVLLDNSNRIWWSPNNGIMQLNVDGEQYRGSDRPPKIRMSEIEINGMHVDYRNNMDSLDGGLEFDSVYRFSNIPANLHLSHSLNNLTFHFTALDWSAPHQIRYSYFLEGISKDWSTPDKAAYATFQRLRHGDYTLKIRALGKSNRWSDTLSYSFAIYPPWWLTWWAKSLYLVLGLLAVTGIIRLRTRSLEIRSRKLEETVQERTAALKETQYQLIQSEKMASIGQLTAGIAHEINNPVSFTQASSFALDQDLTDITKLIDKYRSYIQKGKQDRSEIEDFEKSIDYKLLVSSLQQEISDIKEGTKRTAEIVKNLREFSYEATGGMASADIHQGIDATLNLLQSRFTKEIILTKKYDQSIGLIKCHIAQLNQVFMNLLSNALDAIEEKGEIVVITKKQGNKLKISIKDNGRGITEEEISKIFDPFFTTKEIGRGIGLGLSISHRIINDHGGTISVVSDQKKETRFDIIIPIIK